MHRSKSPPVNLDKYLKGRKHNYSTYEDGARAYSMSYWSFVRLCQEAKANIQMSRTAFVDMDILDAYIDEHFDEKGKEEDMRRKQLENLEGMVKTGKKKYVRYAEGAELYSMGLATFTALAREANATRKVKGVVLCNTEKIDAFIESFEEDNRYV